MNRQVYEVTSGIRAGGAAEVQVISITGSGDGSRNNTNPDEAVIRGYWRAQFAESNFRCSKYAILPPSLVGFAFIITERIRKYPLLSFLLWFRSRLKLANEVYVLLLGFNEFGEQRSIVWSTYPVGVFVVSDTLEFWQGGVANLRKSNIYHWFRRDIYGSLERKTMTHVEHAIYRRTSGSFCIWYYYAQP